MSVLVGKRAPSFRAKAVINNEVENEFSLDRYLGKKHVLFFFYPADFSSVCPSEVLAFQDRLHEFEQKGVAIVACSVDSHLAHLAWLRTPRNQGGIEGVTYPLVSDASMTISGNYDVLAGHFDYNEDGEMLFTGSAVAYRGLFLIDKDGIVRHQLVNDGPIGRNIEEAMRMVDALQHFEKYGEVCPANWEASKVSATL